MDAKPISIGTNNSPDSAVKAKPHAQKNAAADSDRQRQGEGTGRLAEVGPKQVRRQQLAVSRTVSTGPRNASSPA